MMNRAVVKPLLFQASATLRLGSGPLICAISEVSELIGGDPFVYMIIICFVVDVVVVVVHEAFSSVNFNGS